MTTLLEKEQGGFPLSPMSQFHQCQQLNETCVSFSDAVVETGQLLQAEQKEIGSNEVK